MASIATSDDHDNPIPVIDLGHFRAGGKARAALAKQVDYACREVGFLVITGHGVDPQLIECMDAIGRIFFDLPEDEKMACHGPDGPVSRGYTSVGRRALARTLGDATAIGDWRETFSMGRPTIDPEDPYFTDDIGQQIFQPNLFPEALPDMKIVMELYYVAMSGLADEIMQLFAIALGLERNWFAPLIDRHITGLVITNYPDQQTIPQPGQLRAGAHTDYGTLTILRAEDKPGGLEICTLDGRWVKVPVLPGSFIINIGDMMARWTNDRWRSTLHRVVNPPRDAVGSTRRQSIVFFHQPNYDAEIACLPSCIGAGARYAPTTSGAHLIAKLDCSRT